MTSALPPARSSAFPGDSGPYQRPFPHPTHTDADLGSAWEAEHARERHPIRLWPRLKSQRPCAASASDAPGAPTRAPRAGLALSIAEGEHDAVGGQDVLPLADQLTVELPYRPDLALEV